MLLVRCFESLTVAAQAAPCCFGRAEPKRPDEGTSVEVRVPLVAFAAVVDNCIAFG